MVGVTVYISTHCACQLPAGTGQTAKKHDAKKSTPAQQRAQASAFYNFFKNPQNDNRDLDRDDSTVFNALASIPDSNLVKVVYGMGIGTPYIGQVSPITGKLLALFSEGGGVLGQHSLSYWTHTLGIKP